MRKLILKKEVNTHTFHRKFLASLSIKTELIVDDSLSLSISSSNFAKLSLNIGNWQSFCRFFRSLPMSQHTSDSGTNSIVLERNAI